MAWLAGRNKARQLTRMERNILDGLAQRTPLLSSQSPVDVHNMETYTCFSYEEAVRCEGLLTLSITTGWFVRTSSNSADISTVAFGTRAFPR